MKNGFIKLHRKILDWEWYDDPNCMRLFLHCLLRANFKDNNWRGITIKRGSFLTSIDTLSKETKLSISQIRTSIKKLKSTREIASLSHARHSVITIVEYESYQSVDKLGDIDATLESQRDDFEIATNKNVKKEKNGKNSNIPYEEIRLLYNQTLPELKGANILDKKRKTALKESWDLHPAHQNLEFWQQYFEAVRNDDFAMGRTVKMPPHENWIADFSYVVKTQTVLKITEMPR